MPIVTGTLTDRRGAVWVAADNYQDRDATAPGWLALVSTFGEVETFAAVVALFGFTDRGANAPYLIFRLAADDEAR